MTLSWDVVQAATLTIDNGLGPVYPFTGSQGVDVAVSTTFTLTAWNPTGTATALATVTVTQPSGNDISGKVTDAHSNPAAGLTVLVTDSTGVKNSVTTDIDGNFSVTDVARPYTASVVSQNSVYIFPNLTRAIPKLFLSEVVVPDNRSGDLDFTITDGGLYPQPTANYNTVISFASPRASQTLLYTGPGDVAGVLDPSWVDTTTTVAIGTLFGLQLALDDAGVPIDYLGYGSVSAQLRDQKNTTAILAFSPVAAAELTGSVAVPPTYGLDEIDFSLNAPPNLNMFFFGQKNAPSLFSYLAPSIPGTTLTVTATASGPTGISASSLIGLAADAAGVALDCRAAPIQTAPPGNQTGVTTATVFSWSPFVDGVYLISFQPNNGDGGPSFFLWNETTNASIPDLTSIGFGLPANAEYVWQVVGLAPYGGIDALTNPGAASPAYEAFSLIHGFTTAPVP
ncbi:MAG: carboxypeptidase regulatory-like domain-containing protein [Myxococcaceae bacterium]